MVTRIDTKPFVEFLEAEFPELAEDHYLYDLLMNLVHYAYKTHGHSKGSARAIVAEIMPDVTVEELAPYLPDFAENEE